MFKLYEVNYSKKRKVILQGTLSQMDQFFLTFKHGQCYGDKELLVQMLRKEKKIFSTCSDIILQNGKDKTVPLFVGENEKKLLMFSLALKQEQELGDNDPLQLNERTDKKLYTWYNGILDTLKNDSENQIIQKAFGYGLFEERLYKAILEYLKYSRNPNHSDFYNRQCADRSKKIDGQILRYNVIRSLLTSLTLPVVENEKDIVKFNPYKGLNSDSGIYANFPDNEEFLTTEELEESYSLDKILIK